MRTANLNQQRLLILFLLIAAALPGRLLSQSTISTGSIEGVITDPSAAVIGDAKITITNAATGQLVETSTNALGWFSSGPLIPGSYIARISAHGFSSAKANATVLVGNVTALNVSLQVGTEQTTLNVRDSSVQVNTEQATIQGVLTAEEIETLPVNGRNFLELAQLEPGVQIQDAANFGFGKDGFSSISFGGRSGRTARVEIDGTDVSDEIFGSTTTNIPASAIQEFQLSQSSMDLSTELTSSGAVNVTTRSGSNEIHGQAFGLFRDGSVAAALPSPPGFPKPFQRSQYGARVGGPIAKNRLFYFLDGERTLQHEQAPVLVAPPFQQYSGSFSAPFRENDLLGRLDFQPLHSVRAFYRFSYFQDSFRANGGSGFSVYAGKNVTRTHVAGFDANTGSFSHSFRIEYLKTGRDITDATSGNSLPFANYPLNISMGNTGLVTGPNGLAPETILQSDGQAKYDGTKIFGRHILRYGVAYNRIAVAGFVPVQGLAPFVTTNIGDAEESFAATGPFSGGIGNPLNYPVESVTVSNGIGYVTPFPGLGLPAGSATYRRFGLYAGGTSRWRSNFTLNYGVRFSREPGRSDSEFPRIPELNALIPGLGNPVRLPNSNWAPQLGFAWDPAGQGKTSIRAGIGLFYENVLTIIAPLDPTSRSPVGNVFLQLPAACGGTDEPILVPIPGGVLQPTFCSTSSGSPVAIGTVASQIAAFQKLYQADSPFSLTAPNPNYAGTLVSQGIAVGGLFDPNYRTPRSLDINVGVQQEIRPGLVVSADFVRNVQTHYLLGIDENHTGDVRYFNKAAALEAISATNQSFGCGTMTNSATVQCAINAGAQITDYSLNGLTSSGDFGAACLFASVTVPGNSYGCAFGGINSAAPPLSFFKPIGRSVYNGLQTKLIESTQPLWRGVRSLNFQISYALSRFENAGGGGSGVISNADQDAGATALDNTRPGRYFGPSVLDRTHQISFGGSITAIAGLQLSILSHFWSPLATSLFVPNTNLGPGEIFRTDFSGDGTVQDPVPGTHVGSFDRGVSASNLNRVLATYNSSTALNLTPAGSVLVQNGLVTPAELGVGDGLCYQNPNQLPVNSLCAIAPPVPLAPADQVNLSWLRALDLKVAGRRTFHERLTIEPSVSFHNFFNFANFDLPGTTLNGLLTGAAGQINGTNQAAHNITRVGTGTGVYSLGSARQVEFGLRIDF